jgi:hypothetical protein
MVGAGQIHARQAAAAVQILQGVDEQIVGVGFTPTAEFHVRLPGDALGEAPVDLHGRTEVSDELTKVALRSTSSFCIDPPSKQVSKAILGPPRRVARTTLRCIVAKVESAEYGPPCES